MKKRIGIVSMYHGSRNYGGLLQAFALCKFLNNQGFNAKQIDLPPEEANIAISRLERLKHDPLKFIKGVPDGISSRIRNTLFKVLRRDLYNACVYKDKTMDGFRKTIPHVDTIKNSKDILEYNKDFDVFVCGSDQIWNPYAYRPEYFLKFADDEKIKVSYAASIAKKSLDDEELERIRDGLENIDYISVREENAKTLLGKVCTKVIDVVLDPTMLLTEEDWSQYLESSGINGDFIFYYMFENDHKRQRFVKRFAKKHGLNIVAIPQICSSATWLDIGFDFIQGKANTPFEFLSLIRDAKYVITDSFHAVVFSCLFKKDFLCFECKRTKTLWPRISNLLEIYGCADRYIVDFSDSVYSIDPKKIDYSSGSEKFEEIRKKSVDYLLASVKGK